VHRLVDAGAQCIKALCTMPCPMHRSTGAQAGWVERVGLGCAGCDVPFFLEIVPYEDGMDEKSPELRGVSRLFSRLRARILPASLFVDVLKVGVPVTMAYSKAPRFLPEHSCTLAQKL